MHVPMLAALIAAVFAVAAAPLPRRTDSVATFASSASPTRSARPSHTGTLRYRMQSHSARQIEGPRDEELASRGLIDFFPDLLVKGNDDAVEHAGGTVGSSSSVARVTLTTDLTAKDASTLAKEEGRAKEDGQQDSTSKRLRMDASQQAGPSGHNSSTLDLELRLGQPRAKPTAPSAHDHRSSFLQTLARQQTFPAPTASPHSPAVYQPLRSSSEHNVRSAPYQSGPSPSEQVARLSHSAEATPNRAINQAHAQRTPTSFSALALSSGGALLLPHQVVPPAHLTFSEAQKLYKSANDRARYYRAMAATRHDFDPLEALRLDLASREALLRMQEIRARDPTAPDLIEHREQKRTWSQDLRTRKRAARTREHEAGTSSTSGPAEGTHNDQHTV